MKIVHTEASLGWGGQEIRILEESKGLAELGYEVILLAPAESNIYKSASKWGVPATPIAIGKKRISGVFALRRWIQANNPDVINTHSSTDTWLTALACRLLKDPPPIVRTRHISAPIPKTLTSKWLYRKAVSHIVTTGERLRQQVIQETGVSKDAVTSVPTGIDPERFMPSANKEESKIKLGLDPNKKYIGIVATLRSWKGHAFLIEAFHQLEQPNWDLLIIGDGPMRETLKVQANGSGSKNRIHFVGQQSNPEDWMQALDIFCLPSYANEGVPQAILQAMFSALPIITTAVGAIPEAIESRTTGIVIPKKDVSALSSALELLIVEKNLGHELGTNANHAANKKFSKNQMLVKMDAIFSQAIRSSLSV